MAKYAKKQEFGDEDEDEEEEEDDDKEEEDSNEKKKTFNEKPHKEKLVSKSRCVF